jgi:hypothetical protein
VSTQKLEQINASAIIETRIASCRLERALTKRPAARQE